MTELMQFAISGITVGIIYSAVGVGFTIIYNASHIVNFAQGEFVMLGAMLCVVLLGLHLPYAVAAALAVLLTAGVGLLLYDFVIRPARNAPLIMLVIATIGASIFIRGVARPIFGTGFVTLPPIAGDTPILLGGAVIQPQSLVVVAGTAVAVGLLWFFMRRTLLGKALVAASSDAMAATLMGIQVSNIVRLSFVLSASLAAISGILIAPIALASYEMGTLLALKGFAAAILGGMGSIPGAALGGLLLGITEAMSAGYLSSDYKDATAFVVIMAVLFFLPNGLFGVGETHRA